MWHADAFLASSNRNKKYLRYETDQEATEIVLSNAKLELSKGFKEGHSFDITHSSAKLSHGMKYNQGDEDTDTSSPQ